MHHRELGVAGATLYFDDMYCEFAKQTWLTVKHDDGREEIIDNSKYENIKDLEMSYIDSVKNVIKHSKLDIFDIMKMTSINR